MKKATLQKYARLIARTGANVHPGQDVIIRAGLDQPAFVQLLCEECYRAGAREVTVEWSYQPLTRTHVQYCTVDTLARVQDWEVEKLKHRVQTLPVLIYLTSEDPDGLQGVDQEKMARGMQGRYAILKPYQDQMDNKYQWCIAAVPSPAWAKKVFPHLSTARAQEALWQAILACARADAADPVAAWQQHTARLEACSAYLNRLGITALEYRAANGTQLTVGMMPQAQFLGGGERTQGGDVFFIPNIPTEEVFITPKRGVAEGVVYTSKPYCYHGQLIEGICLHFHEGRVVKATAQKNEALLQQLLQMDEGAAYLGECALVPQSSPVNGTGILFYNTLFDENAACHLALGRGFTNCLRDYEQYSLQQCRELGVNDSMIHEDLMIGTDDLCIYAHTADGRCVEIFHNGEFVLPA